MLYWKRSNRVTTVSTMLFGTGHTPTDLVSSSSVLRQYGTFTVSTSYSHR